MNEKANSYTFDEIAYKATSGCIEHGGLPAGSLGGRSSMPTTEEQVSLEGVLRGNFKDESCEFYNRDRANTEIDQYESKLVPPIFCDADMEPIHTRQDCPKEYVIDRQFDNQLAPRFPWEHSIGYGINSKDLSRQAYRRNNPSMVGGCRGPIPTDPK
jgi:hypothetical protein